MIFLFYPQEEYSGHFGQYEEGNEMFFTEFSRLVYMLILLLSNRDVHSLAQNKLCVSNMLNESFVSQF